MKNYRTIGILGGMGPEATAELYKRIIRRYQTEKGAIDDADFPHILINSVPVEDMLNDLANRRSVIVKQLQQAAQVLEQAGAQFIAIPCNTATIFLDEMSRGISVPILDITEITAQRARMLGCRSVGMLASTSTIRTKIYEDKLKDFGIALLKPAKQDQRKVNQIITRVLAGEKTMYDKDVLEILALQMKRKGADAVILGCTELPLLLSNNPTVALIDTIQTLADAVVENAESFAMPKTVTE